MPITAFDTAAPIFHGRREKICGKGILRKRRPKKAAAKTSCGKGARKNLRPRHPAEKVLEKSCGKGILRHCTVSQGAASMSFGHSGSVSISFGYHGPRDPGIFTTTFPNGVVPMFRDGHRHRDGARCGVSSRLLFLYSPIRLTRECGEFAWLCRSQRASLPALWCGQARSSAKRGKHTGKHGGAQKAENAQTSASESKEGKTYRQARARVRREKAQASTDEPEKEKRRRQARRRTDDCPISRRALSDEGAG